MSAHAFSRAVTGAQTKPAPEDEIVEDSEPERQVLRELAKDRRRTRRRIKSKENEAEKSIIEISSDSSDERITPRHTELKTSSARRPAFEPHNVIEISGPCVKSC